MSQTFDTNVALSAGIETNGQPVDFDGTTASGLTITNNSGVSIQYTADGGTTWTTLANGSSASPTVPDTTTFFMRKQAPSGIPVFVKLSWRARDSFDPSSVAITGGSLRNVSAGGPSNPTSALIQAVSAPDFSTYDTSSFRQIFQIPFAGPVLVRARYETDSTTADTIDNTAFAAGRSVSEMNPLDASGAASPWQVVTATALSTASASYSSNGQAGYGFTSWVMLNVPAPTDGGLGGYVYVGTKRNAGTGRCLVGNAGRPSTDWPSTINALLPSLKYTSMYASGVDYVTTNQNGFTAPTANPSYFAPVNSLEVVPMSRGVLSGVNVGDSTSQGLGTGTPSVQPHNYSWAHIAAHLRNAANLPTYIANYTNEGKTSAFYLARFQTITADSTFAPSFVILQPFSVNDGTFTESTVQSGLATALSIARTLRARGTQVIFRTVLPSVNANSAQDAVRQKYNNAIRLAGYAVLDLDTLVTDNATPARIQSSLTYDGTHLNRAGNEICAPALQTLLSRLFLN